MQLKELRKQKKLTQAECAKYLGIPLRTYQLYESNEAKCPDIKYRFIVQKLEEYGFIDETTGILDLEIICSVCEEILPKFNVKYCYLFGSYAKHTAKQESDVDLLISCDLTGLAFYKLAEVLRQKLCKKVDLLKTDQLKDNPILIDEILNHGIKIYG